MVQPFSSPPGGGGGPTQSAEGGRVSKIEGGSPSLSAALTSPRWGRGFKPSDSHHHAHAHLLKRSVGHDFKHGNTLPRRGRCPRRGREGHGCRKTSHAVAGSDADGGGDPLSCNVHNPLRPSATSPASGRGRENGRTYCARPNLNHLLNGR